MQRLKSSDKEARHSSRKKLITAPKQHNSGSSSPQEGVNTWDEESLLLRDRKRRNAPHSPAVAGLREIRESRNLAPASWSAALLCRFRRAQKPRGAWKRLPSVGSAARAATGGASQREAGHPNGIVLLALPRRLAEVLRNIFHSGLQPGSVENSHSLVADLLRFGFVSGGYEDFDQLACLANKTGFNGFLSHGPGVWW